MMWMTKDRTSSTNCSRNAETSCELNKLQWLYLVFLLYMESDHFLYFLHKMIYQIIYSVHVGVLCGYWHGYFL